MSIRWECIQPWSVRLLKPEHYDPSPPRAGQTGRRMPCRSPGTIYDILGGHLYPTDDLLRTHDLHNVLHRLHADGALAPSWHFSLSPISTCLQG